MSSTVTSDLFARSRAPETSPQWTLRSTVSAFSNNKTLDGLRKRLVQSRRAIIYACFSARFYYTSLSQSAGRINFFLNFGGFDTQPEPFSHRRRSPVRHFWRKPCPGRQSSHRRSSCACGEVRDRHRICVYRVGSCRSEHCSD